MRTHWNIWNIKIKKAFGNDEESDEIEYERLGVTFGTDLEYDAAELKQDILDNILYKEK